VTEDNCDVTSVHL